MAISQVHPDSSGAETMDLMRMIRMLMAGSMAMPTADDSDQSMDYSSSSKSGWNDWRYLTFDNFTVNHNLDMVRSLARDEEHFQQVLDSPMRASIKEEETIFTLFTRNNANIGTRIVTGDTVTLAEVFDASKPVMIATHGYLSSARTDWMKQLVQAQLRYSDCNFFTLDWSECADTFNYPRAMKCTGIVGGYLNEFLKFLVSSGVDIKKVHLMGHSLGSHLVAQVSTHGTRVGRISGWDPAGVLYGSVGVANRIDPDDADFVDIIHTSNVLGWEDLLGTIDFFPNGGNDQPECNNYICRHSMSYYYYIQSLYNPEKYPALKCATKEDAYIGHCNGPIAYMGVKSIEGEPGAYWVQVDKPATGEPFLPLLQQSRKTQGDNHI